MKCRRSSRVLDRRHVGVVRRKDRLRLPEPGEAKDPAYLFESLDFTAVERRTHAYFVDFQPMKGAKLRTHVHPGGEFIYILEGTLELTVGQEDVALEAHDSAYFDASRPHGYRRGGAKPCRAIVVTSPP
jgi:mannose-6-phosphate isomerase-like protein (cupin superfamily)